MQYAIIVSLSYISKEVTWMPMYAPSPSNNNWSKTMAVVISLYNYLLQNGANHEKRDIG